MTDLKPARLPALRWGVRANAAIVLATFFLAIPGTQGVSSVTEQSSDIVAVGPIAPQEPDVVVAPRKREEKKQETARPRAASRAKRPADRLELFKGLGAWVDLYDFDLDPRSSVAIMKRNGVRTLFIETATSNRSYSIDPRVRPWLVEGHRAGLKVVGWYLPAYRDVRLDVARTVAIATYRYEGHRFDGAGIDIEDRSGVKNARKWSNRVWRHAMQVRKKMPEGYPLASIPPTPLQMAVAPGHWAGFPWERLAKYTDGMLLMSYWSDRSGCPKIRKHCAYEFTKQNVELTRKLTRQPKVLVHIIGGIGDAITAGELKAFARAARDAKADGASLYDHGTTRQDWWSILRVLRSLG